MSAPVRQATCRNGHPLTPGNLYKGGGSGRQCARCAKDRAHRKMLRQREERAALKLAPPAPPAPKPQAVDPRVRLYRQEKAASEARRKRRTDGLWREIAREWARATAPTAVPVVAV